MNGWGTEKKAKHCTLQEREGGREGGRREESEKYWKKERERASEIERRGREESTRRG